MRRIFYPGVPGILLLTSSISPAGDRAWGGTMAPTSLRSSAAASNWADEATVTAKGVRRAVVVLPAAMKQGPGAGQAQGNIPDQDMKLAGHPEQEEISRYRVISPKIGPGGTPVPVWMLPGDSRTELPGRSPADCRMVTYRPTGFLRADAEIRRSRVYPLMSRVACEYGVPVGLFDALIIQESRYRAEAISVRNAYGLTQLMPGTAAALGVDRYDEEANLRGGARYLRSQVDRFGRYHLALAAYNAGPGRVQGGRVPRIAETEAYVSQILNNWGRLSGARTSPGHYVTGAMIEVPAAPRIATVAVFE